MKTVRLTMAQAVARFLAAQQTVVDGDVDFNAVLGQLVGYSGWLVVEAEQDPEKAPPAEYAVMGCRNLRAMAAAAGLC